jgi:glutamate dehydrogenase (NADP+)
MIEPKELIYPHEKEFLQAAEQHLKSIAPVLEGDAQYRHTAMFERLVEPERMVTFRVPWSDDRGHIRVNRGFRVEMNSAIGPYKGGLRFHPSVNPSIFKFLAFEQTFANALTTMPLGGASGGSDFDPKGKSDQEVMRFCQSYMSELFRHIGPHTDIPSGDMGVGAREIGYLFGMYKKLSNEFTGAITGKGLGWGGSLLRAEAAGYGCVYFAAAMLAMRNQSLEGKTCLISGSGKMALAIADKLIHYGAKVLTLSDSDGHIYDESGIDRKKLDFVRELKFKRLGRIQSYVDQYPAAEYVPADPLENSSALWNHWADCAFPAATENEISQRDAYNLINHRIKVVCEAANMPCTAEAREVLLSRRDILYAPAKAANAGGVALAGLEMVQNSMRLGWTFEEVDQRLKLIMKNIHRTCLEAAAQYGTPDNYVAGADIAGFVKVAEAMIDQGLV